MTDSEMNEIIDKGIKEKLEERKKGYVPFRCFRDMVYELDQHAKIVQSVEEKKWYYIAGAGEVGGCHFDLRECWNEINNETGRYERKVSDEVRSVGAEELLEGYFFEGVWPVGVCN